MHAHFLSQDPEQSNGKILGFNVTFDEDGRSETHVVRSKELKFSLKGENASVKVTAYNSVGASHESTLIISRPVKGM